MDINRGDRFDYLVSMSSRALGRALYDIPDFTRGRYKTREPLQVARASESRRFAESLPARNHDRRNERKIPS